jgi:carboxypeptidase D
LWQYGTFKPVPNPYKWNNLTNVVWVEQPVGTGFSQGTPTATSEKDVAEQFLGFFKNFVTTFAMEGYKVFIAGESYAGYYVPYIADAMLNKKDKTHFDLEATMIYDPSVSTDQIQEQIPAVQFVDYWKPLFSFNDSFTDYLHNASDACGYTAYLDKYVTFPPSGIQPSHSPGTDKEGKVLEGCDVFDDIFNAVLLTNPCFDIYQVATTCPLLWDVMGFPGSFDYVPEGATIYFDRADVKKAINAPVHTKWLECTDKHVFLKDNDLSPPSGAYNGVLPGVIERSKRTIIAHAALDMVLILNGTMLMIQNLTWGGKMGFQKKPTEPFYVPYHDDPSLSTLAASGIMGTTHTERKLTWVTVDL